MSDMEYSGVSTKRFTRAGEMTVYTSHGCFRCEMLKKWLKSRNLVFEEKSLDDVEVMADLIMRNAVILSAPVLEIEEALLTEDQIFDDDGAIKDALVEIFEEAE